MGKNARETWSWSRLEGSIVIMCVSLQLQTRDQKSASQSRQNRVRCWLKIKWFRWGPNRLRGLLEGGGYQGEGLERSLKKRLKLSQADGKGSNASEKTMLLE